MKSSVLLTTHLKYDSTFCKQLQAAMGAFSFENIALEYSISLINVVELKCKVKKIIKSLK